MLVFEKNEEVAPYQGAPRAGYSFTYVRPLHAYALFGGANADTDLYLFSISTTSSMQTRMHGAASLQADRRSRPAESTTLQPSSVIGR
jgi:hypothetical protein